MYERIRNLREDSDIKQWQVAKILGCSPRAYSNYEIGDWEIPIKHLIKLSDFHDVSVDYLLGV